MSGRGVYKASTGEQGHQFVKLKVEVPRSITPEQRELLDKCFGVGTGAGNGKAGDKRNAEPDTTTETNQWFDKLRRWLKWY
jgi:DnaJ-class molecular chaperone